tara:strand:+ start:1064 stop:1684 length:621 start_codon:yes stop_codon:yes gene_type:complete
MKTRRQIESRIATETDDGVVEGLMWVLESPDCPMCSNLDRVSLEVKLWRGEITPAFLEQKYGWLPGIVGTHMDEHNDYDPHRAALLEKMRSETISTLNVAEDTTQKIAGWIEELEAQRGDMPLETEWIGDATRLTGQLGQMLKLVGTLKKEIGVDSQLMLASRQMEDVMVVLVDTLKDHPNLLNDLEFRLNTLKTPAVDTSFEVVE